MKKLLYAYVREKLIRLRQCADYLDRDMANLFSNRHLLVVLCCPPQGPSNSNMAASIRVCFTLRFAIRGELFPFAVLAQAHKGILLHISEYNCLSISLTVSVHGYFRFLM